MCTVERVQEIRVRVETSCQRVPPAGLSSLARGVGSVQSGKLLLTTQGCSASLLRVLRDNRIDGHVFVVSRENSVESFIQIYREAHQDIFGL